MKKYIVTLSRQFGSGGSEIGKELAKLLDIKYADKSIIAEAASRSGIAKEIFEKADEKHSNSFLFSLVSAHYGGSAAPVQIDDLISDDKLFLHTADAIKNIANEPCLIVGRCAEDVLCEQEIVRLFIYADFNDRVRRIARLYEINEKAAATLIKKTDKKRANYYNFYTGKQWGAAENYDICVNSSCLRKDGTINVLKSFIEKFYNCD